MKNILSKSIYGGLFILLIVASFSACQKMERPAMNIIPDDTARLNGPLQLFLSFEDSPIDSIHDAKGNAKGNSYVEGIKGKAYKGSTTGQIQYSNAGKLAEMTSFTVAFWMNTEKHSGGGQSVFMMPNTSDFWGNLFAIIEGNDNPDDNSMLFKFNFAGNWVEFSGNNGLDRLPDMYGKWHHLAFSYDENTSKFAAYLDGEKMNLPANISDRKKDNAPLGKLSFKDASQFAIGAYQQHIGIQGDPQDWMLHYTGMLDQFRVYTKALNDEEVKALFTKKE
ncbi:LamG domain-containing protein [Albibacterium sp.]|uniref:LamG domain-containing protein n=1 Tax=Albibacterium sp. TaxID=2952885 RepID=UPI002C66BFB2|nr:LamG domain-containing protein [Albibacterium sp.]HUH19505.1 LamG domain-containing protein [Albibacterium sp.]